MAAALSALSSALRRQGPRLFRAPLACPPKITPRRLSFSSSSSLSTSSSSPSSSSSSSAASPAAAAAAASSELSEDAYDVPDSAPPSPRRRPPLRPIDVASGIVAGVLDDQTLASRERRHTLAVLVDNEAGVLAKISGLLSARGFNIDSRVRGRVARATVRRGDGRQVQRAGQRGRAAPSRPPFLAPSGAPARSRASVRSRAPARASRARAPRASAPCAVGARRRG